MSESFSESDMIEYGGIAVGIMSIILHTGFISGLTAVFLLSSISDSQVTNSQNCSNVSVMHFLSAEVDNTLEFRCYLTAFPRCRCFRFHGRHFNFRSLFRPANNRKPFLFTLLISEKCMQSSNLFPRCMQLNAEHLP
jgi:hypothetical protein